VIDIIVLINKRLVIWDLDDILGQPCDVFVYACQTVGVDSQVITEDQLTI